jgi:N-acetylated-alpha-linked acidic dipeptidase
MNRATTFKLIALLLVSTTLFAQAANEKPLLGFSAASAAKQYALESEFDARLNRDNMRAAMKRLSAHPHHLGSAAGRENAEWIAAQFRSWGYETELETFHVLFPTPRKRVVELIAPERYTLKLAEPAIVSDATSGQSAAQLPTYNAYSVDGNVTGELVYVNYGIPKDYEALAERGIDVKGKIVIARYGGSWRGIKPKVAAENGAIGCLIYSDPRDDGYFQGDVYPGGSWRNEHGAQRGSVADMPVYAGDPLTPGVAATKDAKRLARSEATTLTKIPVLPISYADAQPLLRALAGPVAPESWRGALPMTYHLGPGPAKVHMELAFDWNIVPAHNVIARLRGSEKPDQWVMRGNHHDAWVNGADDPISGLVSMMDEARAIGELAKSGARPKRSIVYAAWDGEEQGLLGSTEWVEAHRDALQSNLIAYINSDSNGRGFLSAGGSHTLERFVTQVARDVVDPQRSVSVLERRRARDIVTAETNTLRKEIRERELLRLSPLGSGSDFTPFFQHAGIASLNIGYGGEDGGGSYHSVYDSFDHYTRFGDPKFDYGVAQAQTNGRLVLRIANADVLPFEFTTFADTIGRYLDEVKKLADDARADVEENNRQARDKTAELAADPTATFVAAKTEETVPYLNFAPLQNAVAKVQSAARDYSRVKPAKSSEELDRALLQIEQRLTTKEGLPARPWYRHAVYAPGLYTGYGVKTFPAVREAIELKKWDEASEQIVVLARVLDGYAKEVERATALARAANGR